MCTKIGGAPWMVHIPPADTMTIGFDISVDTASKDTSYGALVATMDLKKGVEFFSAVSSSRDSDGLTNDFSMNVIRALHAFKEINGILPKRIFIYRGGVGDGQLSYIRDIEVKSIEEKLKKAYGENRFQMTFIVVNKRINARIFQDNRNNPPAGTIVDDVITLPER